jgi:hypothetical protein
MYDNDTGTERAIDTRRGGVYRVHLQRTHTHGFVHGTIHTGTQIEVLYEYDPYHAQN